MAYQSHDYRHYRRKKKKPNRTIEILAVIAAVLTVCCAYAGRINPESFLPAPFLMLAFMPMFIVTLALMLVALLWRRWFSLLPLMVAVAAVFPVTRLYLPFNTSETAPAIPAERTSMLKVMTYNVLAFNYNDPALSSVPSATMRLILDADPDVVLLQEGAAGGLDWADMQSVAPFMGEIEKRYPYRHAGSDGLAIMSRYPFATHPVGEPQHMRSPLGYNRDMTSYIARYYDLQLPDGKQLRLFNFRLQSYNLSFGQTKHVRVSPEVKPSALERMRRSFTLRGDNATQLRAAIDASPDNVIVCGDMNDVPASHVYRVIRGNDLRDGWCDAGNGYARTYNRHHLCYRIDHVLYRGNLLAIAAERLTGGSSDHYPLLLTFDIDYNHHPVVDEN